MRAAWPCASPASRPSGATRLRSKSTPSATPGVWWAGPETQRVLGNASRSPPEATLLRRVVFRILVVVVIRHVGIDAIEHETEDVDLALIEHVQRLLREAG